ncbi:MAG: hypothetical protein H0W07_10260 [Chloroflexi bacterium]|nr:hypothetical protein [Chloroflexota bacterium]
MIDVSVVWAVVAGALVVVALALVLLAVAVMRLAGDARRLVVSSDSLLSVVAVEVPPTLRHIRELSANLERLSGDLDPRLQRVDVLLDETEATLAVLRSSLEATEEIVRGPLDAVNNARRAARSIGDGIASGADRLLRRAGRSGTTVGQDETSGESDES